MTAEDICEVILCIFIPPLGVLVSGWDKSVPKDELTKDICINILLTLLLIIPGIIHAIYKFNQYKTSEKRILKYQEEMGTKSVSGRQTQQHQQQSGQGQQYYGQQQQGMPVNAEPSSVPAVYKGSQNQGDVHVIAEPA